MTSLLVLGAGGHSKVLIDTARATEQFTNFALLDDSYDQSRSVNSVLGWPVLGPLARAFDSVMARQYDAAIVAIGSAPERLKWLSHLLELGYRLPVIVHPTAWSSPSATIGLGTVLFAQSVLQAEATTGVGVILNTGSSADHDCQIGDGVHLCPGARLAGGVVIGQRSTIGIGASVIQQVRIGSNVFVGAGATVVRDLPDGVTAIGVPARGRPHS